VIMGNAVLAGCDDSDGLGLPSAEEWRMVRAIALQALCEAARFGEYRASFRGFEVLARRQPMWSPDACIAVRLAVTLPKAIIAAEPIGLYIVIGGIGMPHDPGLDVLLDTRTV